VKAVDNDIFSHYLNLLLVCFVDKLISCILESFLAFDRIICNSNLLKGKIKKVIALFCWGENHFRLLEIKKVIHKERVEEPFYHILKLVL
jgi:hypothetical protein